jgi:hypothetical protein
MANGAVEGHGRLQPTNDGRHVSEGRETGYLRGVAQDNGAVKQRLNPANVIFRQR